MNPHEILDIAARQLVQLTFVFLIAEILTRFFCRARPHLAYVIWAVVLIKAITPPIWSSRTSIFTWTSPANETAMQTKSIAPRATVLPARHIALPQSPSPITSTTWTLNLAQLALDAWLVGGVVFVLLVAGRGWWWLRRIHKSSIRPSREILNLAAEVRRSVGLRRAPRLRFSQEPIGPAVFGFVRPILLIPCNILRTQSLQQIRSILAHEMIHVRRRDHLISFVQFLAQALWWFNTLIWWTNRQINRYRELSCDEEVVALGSCSAPEYAQTLIDVLRMRQSSRDAGLGIHSVGMTVGRLNHIMNPRRQPHGKTPRVYWVALAAGLFVVLPGAGLPGSGGAGRSGVVLAQNVPSPNRSSAASTQPSTLSPPAVTTTVHYVRIVVSVRGELSFQGKVIRQSELETCLRLVPDAQDTVLELAYAYDQVPVGDFNRVQSRCLELVSELHLKYLTSVGRQDFQSVGSADQYVTIPAAGTAVSADLTPKFQPVAAPDSELTFNTKYQLSSNTLANGDDIQIQQIVGTSDHFVIGGTYKITGTYTLQSADTATLAAWTTMTRGSGPNASLTAGVEGQTLRAARGTHQFTLIMVVPYEGNPHVSFYDERRNIGGVYLGSTPNS